MSADGVRGGIDLAFMSTTEDRAVALHYAGSRGGPAVALELQQGLISRGADISWVSQYAHEKEVLFAPLTACEVRSMRAEGAVLVAEISLTINLAAATLERVIGRRKHMLTSMGDEMAVEVQAQLAGSGAEADAAESLHVQLESGALRHDREWYNVDANFISRS